MAPRKWTDYCANNMKEDHTFEMRSNTGAPLPPSACRILVVDDDDDIRRLNAQALLGSGYHVRSAGDGAAAWEALQNEAYHLMITDHEMPKVSGVELLKKVHASRMALPVIMATGDVPESEFARFPWLRPAAVIKKPYMLDELLEKVRQVLHGVVGAGVQYVPPSVTQNPPNVRDWQDLLVCLRQRNI